MATLGHTAPYPEDIPNFAAKVFGKKGKYILDPYLGSGTSIISAAKNKYIGVGVEFSAEYAELAKNRFEENRMANVVNSIEFDWQASSKHLNAFFNSLTSAKSAKILISI